MNRGHRVGDAGVIRLAEPSALVNVRTMLELTASGALRCSTTTKRPTAATVRVDKIPQFRLRLRELGHVLDAPLSV